MTELMPTLPAPARYTPGAEATYVVGVRGAVTHATPTALTIAGHTLPYGLSDSVVYMSVELPDDGYDESEPPVTYGKCLCMDDEVYSKFDAAHTLLEQMHDSEAHGGPFQFCSRELCKAVND